MSRSAKKLLAILCSAAYVGGMPEGRHVGDTIPAGRIGRGKGAEMVKNFEDLQKLNKDNMDVTLKSFGAVSKSCQAIAVELADYSKKSFEQSTAAVEKLLGAKSFDKAVEVQTEYAKSAYEAYVTEAAKFGELFTELAKESYKPFESYVAAASTTK
jgi:hypothetical protein